MKIFHDPVDVIRKEIDTWDSPFVKLDCFGIDNPMKTERGGDTWLHLLGSEGEAVLRDALT